MRLGSAWYLMKSRGRALIKARVVSLRIFSSSAAYNLPLALTGETVELAPHLLCSASLSLHSPQGGDKDFQEDSLLHFLQSPSFVNL